MILQYEISSKLVIPDEDFYFDVKISESGSIAKAPDFLDNDS